MFSGVQFKLLLTRVHKKTKRLLRAMAFPFTQELRMIFDHRVVHRVDAVLTLGKTAPRKGRFPAIPVLRIRLSPPSLLRRLCERNRILVAGEEERDPFRVSLDRNWLVFTLSSLRVRIRS